MGGGEVALYLGTHGDDRVDLRKDLDTISVPTLVTHGDSGATVPFEVPGNRTGQSVPGVRTVVVSDGPQGVDVSHAGEVTRALLDLLARRATPTCQRCGGHDLRRGRCGGPLGVLGCSETSGNGPGGAAPGRTPP